MNKVKIRMGSTFSLINNCIMWVFLNSKLSAGTLFSSDEYLKYFIVFSPNFERRRPY